MTKIPTRLKYKVGLSLKAHMPVHGVFWRIYGCVYTCVYVFVCCGRDARRGNSLCKLALVNN